VQQFIDTDTLERQLTNITESLRYLLPEAVLLAFLLLLLLSDLIFSKRATYWLISISLLGFIAHLFSLYLQWKTLLGTQESLLLLDMLHLDGMAIFFKGLFSLAGVLAILLSIHYRSGTKEMGIESLRSLGEYYVILYGLILGASLMAMSANFLMLYLSLELVSICSYILTNFNFDKKSAEAGIKYLLFGGVASGLMLYGISLIYGFGGSLLFTDLSLLEGLIEVPAPALLIVIMFVSAGLLFKISSVPFHIWTPDVYEGAPTPVVALFSVVPKLAGLVLLLRILPLFDGLYTNIPYLDWQWAISAVAIITIVVGNFAALSQTNAKRMLAYSSIAHSGFLLIGVVAYSEFATHSIAFYAAVYLLMNFAAFLLIKIVSRQTGYEYIKDYKGLGKELPLLAILLLIVMISLTGLPPTAGFTAKLFIFSSLWQTYQDTNSTIMVLLLLIGLLNTVVSLFYYLKIPYFMFFKQKEDLSEEKSGLESQIIDSYRTIHLKDKVLAIILIFPLLLLFFKADWLMEVIKMIHF